MDLHLNTPSQLVAKISTALQNLSEDVRFAGDFLGDPTGAPGDDQTGNPTGAPTGAPTGDPTGNPTGKSVGVPAGDLSVVVAISGGPDSTALLLALHMLSTIRKLSLRACHVNHKLRGTESENDEDFCKILCKKLSVPLSIYSAASEDVDPNASESTLRATRYDFLFECAQANNSRFVLLAHNSNDQVETVLFRILRGTSPKGITGMKDAHQMKNGIWLLRPMLACSRDEVREFLESCGVIARQDSSNQSSKYARNFLRNQVIPLCLSRFPTMERQIERLRELVVYDQDFIDAATRAVVSELGSLENNTWAVQTFSDAHIALKHRLLAEAFELRSIEVSFERVEVVLSMMAPGSGEGRVSLNSQWDVAVDATAIKWIDKKTLPESFPFNPLPLKIPGRTMVLQLGQVFNIEEWSGSQSFQFPERTELAAYVDLSETVAPLVLRKIGESDRITPIGMSQSVGLKKYLKNSKIESTHGDKSPHVVLADQKEVLWVPGVGLSEKIRVRTSPTHYMSIAAISADFMSV